MRSVAGVAAVCVAVACGIFGFDCAFAETEADRAHVDHFLLFSGFDLWRAGGFVHGGALWSPDGLTRDGFTLKLLIGGGQYRYQSGLTENIGNQALAAAMPGWRFKHERLEIVAYAGVDWQSHRLVPDDPGNRLRGTFAGLRAGADLWYQPSDAMMVSAAASVSTIGSSYWGRGALGWRLLDRFWAGPEVGALGGHNYQQLRAGVHTTSFKTGPLEWSAGFGFARDTDHRAGFYGRIGVLTRQ